MLFSYILCHIIICVPEGRYFLLFLIEILCNEKKSKHFDTNRLLEQSLSVYSACIFPYFERLNMYPMETLC